MTKEQSSAPHRALNRRAFIRNSALIAAGGFLPVTPALAARRPTVGGESFMNFTFRSDGRFKIVQITDTHYISGDPRSERALKTVGEMLDAEKPDLVIHTGDIIFGKPAEESLREMLSVISQRGVPFAVTLGNHDEEFGLSRKEVMDVVKSLPHNINSTVTGITGASNDIITLSAEGSDKPSWVFYLFDSGRESGLEGIGGYGYVHFDQMQWYRRHSAEFAKKNGGVPVPSLCFQHIPPPEYDYALHLPKNGRILKGNWGEDPGSPRVNAGQFVAMKEMGDVKALIAGHEHDNDFALRWNGMFLMYGRYSGCDTVYNNLKPGGARVIELTQGEEGFRSWVRLYGGEITQNLRYPDDFKTY